MKNDKKCVKEESGKTRKKSRKSQEKVRKKPGNSVFKILQTPWTLHGTLPTAHRLKHSAQKTTRGLHYMCPRPVTDWQLAKTYSTW